MDTKGRFGVVETLDYKSETGGGREIRRKSRKGRAGQSFSRCRKEEEENPTKRTL